MNSYRVIYTGLESNGINEKIINSIIDQMKYGIWESYTSLSSYWKAIKYISNFNNEIKIIIDDSSYLNGNKNPYYKASDSTILKFFANKIRTIIGYECKDFGNVDYYKFNVDNDNESYYLDSTIGNACKAYKILINKKEI